MSPEDGVAQAEVGILGMFHVIIFSCQPLTMRQLLDGKFVAAHCEFRTNPFSPAALSTQNKAASDRVMSRKQVIKPANAIELSIRISCSCCTVHAFRGIEVLIIQVGIFKDQRVKDIYHRLLFLSKGSCRLPCM
jgi:hypothetical protein